MTDVLMARHGETDWNAALRIQGQSDSALSLRGCRQAEALAARLARLRIDAIYSSDLSRALDTAAPIAAAHRLAVNPLPDLRERGFGQWEGRTTAEIERDYPEQWHRWRTVRDLHAPVPGGETWEAVYQRIVAALQHILADHPGADETVLLVGHGGSLRAAALHALNAPLPTLLHLHFDNASLSRLRYPDGRVLLLNDTSHLEGLVL